MAAINKAKPASTKGIYLKKVSVSSTMGVGVRIDQIELRRRAGAGSSNKDFGPPPRCTGAAGYQRP